jgi:glycosyltransferase involved in cell wall biosynthesis
MGQDISMREIGALIISADNPQLERCLESVKNQTVPFSNITLIDNVSPEHVALNRGLEEAKDEWLMKIDGDMILYPNAVEIALKRIGEGNEKAYAYNFILYDSFLKHNLRGCGVVVRSVIRKVPYPNLLMDDVWVGQKLRRMGFVIERYREVVGTHFENPSEFQVFKRFYIMGIKHGKRFSWKYLTGFYEETKDPIYTLAMKAIEFGMKKNSYPGSHDMNFDRKIFEEFKNNGRA